MRHIEKLQLLYSKSDHWVRPKFQDEAEAKIHYQDYIKFVTQLAQPTATLLDVGCGNGWSAYLLSKEGYVTSGVDLDPAAFEVLPSNRLSLQYGDAMKLPFADEVFDFVSSYQMLEHVPDPNRALLEMMRVLKPNGVFLLLSPNLLSIGASVRAIVRYVWLNRPIRRIILRDAEMPRHPFGNTLFENIGILLLNICRILKKSVSAKAEFQMRIPDLQPPFHADNDACYLCNPIDICRFMTEHKYYIIQNGKPGRLLGTVLLASGTWIAARKPGR